MTLNVKYPLQVLNLAEVTANFSLDLDSHYLPESPGSATPMTGSMGSYPCDTHTGPHSPTHPHTATHSPTLQQPHPPSEPKTPGAATTNNIVVHIPPLFLTDDRVYEDFARKGTAKAR